MNEFTNRQKQIIQASLELIAQSGIHGLTIKNISKKVGITEPAIYRHFENKNEILLGIISTIKQNTGVDKFGQATEKFTACEIIRKVFTMHAQQFTENPSLAAVIFSEELFDNNSELSATIRTIMDDSQMKFINIILNGQAEGEIIDHIDAEQLALMIMGAFRLLVTKWHMSNNSFDLQKKTANLLNALEKLI